MDIAERIDQKRDFKGIKNLWVKLDNKTIERNAVRPYEQNLDILPFPDWSIFRKTAFFKPFHGYVYKYGDFEMSRGCPYKCAFCNSPRQMAMYRNEIGEHYLRRKTFENIFRELTFYKEEMGAEYLYFWADTFFSWKPGEFESFAEM